METHLNSKQKKNVTNQKLNKIVNVVVIVPKLNVKNKIIRKLNPFARN